MIGSQGWAVTAVCKVSMAMFGQNVAALRRRSKMTGRNDATRQAGQEEIELRYKLLRP